MTAILALVGLVIGVSLAVFGAGGTVL